MEAVAMQIIDHERQPREEWRPGVKTRMRASALNGTVQLCLFEQWCAPGSGAPTHLHAVEEVLTVLEGQADVWIAEGRSTLTAGQSLIVPAGRKHGFRNTGQGTLHVQATLAAPIFEAAYDDEREVPRRWLPAQGLAR
jgi:mannose-6-phosphate isomerase-like protein (cupin superfamily)